MIRPTSSSYSGHLQDEPMIHLLETAGDGLIWFVSVELRD
jgi:hypothetical protein